MQIKFGQDVTKYRGNKVKVAVVVMNGRSIPMGLNDTARCAQGDRGVDGKEIAARVLRNLAEQHGIADPDWEVDGAAEQLRAHCRVLLGMQPAP